MTDDQYIRGVASSMENDARREIEPDAPEEIQKSDLLDGLEDVSLDDTDGKTVRDLMKEQFDASDVLESYDDWSAPLHEQATEPTEDPEPRDTTVIKSAGISRAAYDVDPDRPELEDLTDFKQTVEKEGGVESIDQRREADRDPAWDAVHRATEDAREEFTRFEKEHDEVGAAEAGLPVEYRLAKQMQKTGEGGDVPFDMLVETARELVGKDGRRVYIADPADAPEGVTVHQGPQGGYFYEPSVQQPSAADEMASPGDGGRGEAVNSGTIEPAANQDDAFMGDVNPRTGEEVGEDEVRQWAEAYDFDPEFVNQVVEAVTDLLHPEANPENDDPVADHAHL